MSVYLIAYTYVVYPCVIWLMARMRSCSGESLNELVVFPMVSIVIAAYNEGNIIKKKIENCFSMDYPIDRFEVVIGSDGSTDQTCNLASEYLDKRPLKLLACERRGKVSTINNIVEQCKGDVLVFTDANSILDSGALKELIKLIQLPGVGCVSGLLRLRKQGEHLGARGESFYWKYETFIKLQENQLGAVAGANGAIYALRRELFVPLDVRTINDDFTISMMVYYQKLRVLLAEKATAYEYTSPDAAGEFRRHVRDSAGHYRAMLELGGLLNPFLGMPFFCYVSHRVIRWLVPFCLVGVYLFSFMLRDSTFFRVSFFVQTAGYVGFFSILPFVLRGRNIGIIYAPYYFLLLNLALIVGFFKFCCGGQRALWIPQR
jgi:cellulose synthase/poly-beta-1,6-N-acetylglucosamine synthase-like glycosyltransferase